MVARKTSIVVYRRMEEEGLLTGRRWQIWSMLYKIGPATAAELAERFPVPHGAAGLNVHARLNELMQMGCAEQIGERVCKVTKNSVTLWDVTDKYPKPLPPEVKKTRKRLQQERDAYRAALVEIWKDERRPPWIKAIIQKHTEPLKAK